VSNAQACELCGAPLSMRRRKYDSRRHAVHAAVLRYRTRLGEEYLLMDAARKRLARRRQQLRSEFRWLPPAGRRTHCMGDDEARKERDAIWRQYWIEGPNLAVSSRAKALLLKVGPSTTERGARTWVECAELRVNLGAAYREYPLLDRLLKRIELFHIEQHDYLGLARILLSRFSLYYQLSEDSWDRPFEEALKLDRYLTALFDGPLRKVENSDANVPWAKTWVEHSHRLLRLRLALLNGDLAAVRRRYDGLRELADRDRYCRWQTNIEGVGVYAKLRKWREAERCLVDVTNDSWPPPSPAIFNQMRKQRAEATFYLELGERDMVYAMLEREFLCAWYQTLSDTRFWRRAAAGFGLSGASYRDERLVLVPDLAT
jgi:hypothetical protein